LVDRVTFCRLVTHLHMYGPDPGLGGTPGQQRPPPKGLAGRPVRGTEGKKAAQKNACGGAEHMGQAELRGSQDVWAAGAFQDASSRMVLRAVRADREEKSRDQGTRM
jgi:hypothetical protein